LLPEGIAEAVTDERAFRKASEDCDQSQVTLDTSAMRVG